MKAIVGFFKPTAQPHIAGCRGSDGELTLGQNLVDQAILDGVLTERGTRLLALLDNPQDVGQRQRLVDKGEAAARPASVTACHIHG